MYYYLCLSKFLNHVYSAAAEYSHQPGIQPSLMLALNQTDEHFGASEAVLNWRNLRDKIHAGAAHNAAGLQSHQTSNASAAATDRHFDHAVAQYHAGAASHQTNASGHLATPNQLNAMQTAHHQKQPSSSSRHGETTQDHQPTLQAEAEASQPTPTGNYHRTLSLDTAELISKERDHRILRRMQTFHAYLGRLSPTELAIVKQNAIDEAQANHRRMVGVAPVAAAPATAAAAIHHPEAGLHLVQNDAAVQEPSAALAPSNHQHQQLINHQRAGEVPAAALAQINHERTMMGKSTAPASSSQQSSDHRIDLSNYQQPLSKKGEKSSSHPFGHHSAAFSSPSSSTAVVVHESANVPMQTLLNPLPTQTATRHQSPSLTSHVNLSSPPLRIGEADSTTLGGADHLTALQLATATSTGRELGQQPATGAATLSSASPQLQRIPSFRNILDGMSPAKRSQFQALAAVAQRSAIGGGTSSASHHHLPSAAVSEPSSAIADAPPPLLDLLSPRTAIGHGQPSSSIAGPHHPTNSGPTLELRQPNAAAPHSATGVVELRLFPQHIPERSNVDAGNDYNTSTGRESPSASEPVELLLFPLRNENAASGQPAAKRLRKD